MRDEFALGVMFCQSLAREIYDFLNIHLMKVTILRMFEHRYVIHFLLKDGFTAKETPGRLNQAFWWVRDIRTGCENLSDEAMPGRRCKINLDTVLTHKVELDPHTTARQLAFWLGVSVQTVTNHLHDTLEMKCDHLRWIPHMLDDSQKAIRMCCPQIICEALDRHAGTNYQYLIT
jgi:hypothetical protein